MSKTSKTAVAVPRESGPYDSGRTKNQKPEKVGGPYHSSKHERPAKSAGAHEAKNKSLTHAEDANTHSGRPHPPVDRLADSKLLGGGKLRLSDATKEKK